MENKKKFNQLRKDLRGQYEAISQECGVSPSTVSRVLSGEFHNEKVIEVAISKHKQVILDRKKKANKLTKSLSHIK